MDKRQGLVRRLKNFKELVNNEIPIQKILLFGSFARGKTHKWSDVDLIIVSSKFYGEKTYKRARRLYDYWNLNYPVDFLCYTPEEFNKLKKQVTIVREAVNKGIEI